MYSMCLNVMWLGPHRAIFKNEELHLSIVTKPHPDKDKLYNINVGPIILSILIIVPASFSGHWWIPLPVKLLVTNSCAVTVQQLMLFLYGIWPFHSGIAISQYTIYVKWLLYINSFTVKKVSNVPHQLAEKNLNVSIHAGLCISGKMITDTEKTLVANLKYETIWNQKLMFKDTNIQTIPKV